MKIILKILFLMVSFSLFQCGAKSKLLDDADSSVSDVEYDTNDVENLPPDALCIPDEIYSTIDRITVLYGDGQDDKEVTSFHWTILSSPPGSNISFSPEYGKITSFIPDMEGDYTINLTISDREGLTDSCNFIVHSVTGPPVAICPDDIENVTAGSNVIIEGDGFDDIRLVSFYWEILSRPEGSVVEPNPNNQPVTNITPDLSGEYILRLTVTDNQGQTGSCDIRIYVGGTPEAICPDDMDVPTRQAVNLHGDGTDDGYIAAWEWEILSKPSQSSAQLTSMNTQDTSITPDKAGDYEIRLTVIDDSGLRSSCEFILHAYATPPEAICPADITTTPLNIINLTGDGVDDGYIIGYQWSLLEKPVASAATPPEPEYGQETSFMPDVAGTYVLTLTVTDDDGQTGTCTFRIIATSGEGLRVELYWNPPDHSCDISPYDPNCDHTDIDLHLLHPDSPGWFSDTLDCFYRNCQYSSTGGNGLEWDQYGSSDNPRLDLDDVDGFGPENINVSEPVIGSRYGIGVHYYSDDGQGPSTVYVRIYCNEISTVPVAEYGPVTLNGTITQEYNDFWRVAWVTWNGYDCNVEQRLNSNGEPDIVLADEAQYSR